MTISRTLNPDPYHAAPTLQGLARYFGDRAQISSMREHQEFGSLPTIELELIIIPEDHVSKKEKTVKDVYDELTDEQKKVVGYLMEEAMKDAAKEANQMYYRNWDSDEFTSNSLSGINKWIETNFNKRTVSDDALDAATYVVKTMNDENLKGDSMMEMFNGMFGKVANGMCRLSMNGGIAVKTSNGYKTYNLKSKRLVNCNNFVFNIGEEFFFVIPTNKVETGDIILVNGKPKCVIASDDETITVINYEDSTIDKMLPERHVFMGNTYFYGKIVSMFGNDILKNNGDKGMKKIMSYMMMSEMMKGSTGGKNDMSSMLPLMMMSGGNFGDMFSDIFDFGDVKIDDCSDIEDGGPAGT